MTSVTIDSIAPVIIDLLNQGVNVKINITGVSMLPLLAPKRDKVELAKQNGRINKGDIVLFLRDDNRYVLHRVSHSRDYEDFVLCVGDSQRVREKIQKDCVIAKVVSIERKNKTINTTNIFYKLYVFVWSKLRLIRSKIVKVFYGKYYEK